jgi:predicted PurR-regulated permease PerM
MAVSREIAGSLWAYLKAQIQNAFITTFLFIAAFAITGVPWWFLTGIVCGVVNLVPHLGPLLSLGLGILFRWITTGDWTKLMWVGLAWLVIQILDGFVLSPRAAGRAGINPLLSILITLAAGFFLGPLAMILVVPALAVALIILRSIRSRPRPPAV